MGGPGARANTVWVNSMDELYPPGPGRDLLKANCTGCHGPEFGTMHRTKEGYRLGIARMTETGPTDDAFATNLGHTYLTGAQKDQIAEYLATNFGPGTPDKRLKVDPPILDERRAREGDLRFLRHSRQFSAAAVSRRRDRRK